MEVMVIFIFTLANGLAMCSGRFQGPYLSNRSHGSQSCTFILTLPDCQAGFLKIAKRGSKGPKVYGVNRGEDKTTFSNPFTVYKPDM